MERVRFVLRSFQSSCGKSNARRPSAPRRPLSGLRVRVRLGSWSISCIWNSEFLDYSEDGGRLPAPQLFLQRGPALWPSRAGVTRSSQRPALTCVQRQAAPGGRVLGVESRAESPAPQSSGSLCAEQQDRRVFSRVRVRRPEGGPASVCGAVPCACPRALRRGPPGVLARGGL